MKGSSAFVARYDVARHGLLPSWGLQFSFMRFRRVLAATVIGLALSAVAGVQAAVDPPVEHSVCGFDPTPTTLTYRIGLLWNGGISEADQRTAIRAGVETWETTFDLSLVEVPYTPIVPDVMIHF